GRRAHRADVPAAAGPRRRPARRRPGGGGRLRRGLGARARARGRTDRRRPRPSRDVARRRRPLLPGHHGPVRLIDVLHEGRPHVIGAWLVDGVLIDPGPAATVSTLLEALDGEVPRAIAVTHIHLDHSGAAGTLAREWPGVEVYVHERGAPHLADPEKLLASAGRLYGDAMDALWGETLPVPSERLRVLG